MEECCRSSIVHILHILHLCVEMAKVSYDVILAVEKQQADY